MFHGFRVSRLKGQPYGPFTWFTVEGLGFSFPNTPNSGIRGYRVDGLGLPKNKQSTSTDRVLSWQPTGPNPLHHRDD